MPPGLLEDERIDTDALATIVQQLLVHDGDPLPSLHALDRFSAVSWYAFKHVRANAPQLARDLLSVDMGMWPSDLVSMIREMSPAHRVRLDRMAKLWNTPHTIGTGYFASCTTLALPTLSSSLTVINDSAFYGCTGLIVAEWYAPLLTTVCCNAFARCESLTLTTWTTPFLTSIQDGAFDECEMLTLHTWHAPELKVVEEFTFDGCSALVLSTWDSPELISIDTFAFNYCAKLTLNEWNAPKLNHIRYQAFTGCTSLVWETGCPFPLDIVIEDMAFHGCTNLSSLARSQIQAINPDALDTV